MCQIAKIWYASCAVSAYPETGPEGFLRDKPLSSRILVVEDDVSNADMVRLSLAHAGYVVGLASSGDEALARVAEGWDAVVLDLHLPGLDGFEVARRLRAAPATSGIAVLAVTALSAAADHKAAAAAGIDGYVTKPYLRHELIAALQAALAVRA